MLERMIEAIRAGDAEGVKALLDADPGLADRAGASGVSMAMQALYNGQPAIARLIADRKGTLSLFEAAGLGDVAAVRAAADETSVRALSPDGFTALQFAAFFGQPEAAKALIEAGSELDRLSENGLGVAPIHAALAGGHVGIARALISAGADVRLASAEGYTPLHYCGELGDAELAAELLAMGVDRQAKSKGGQTPADTARANGHDHVADLIERS